MPQLLVGILTTNLSPAARLGGWRVHFFASSLIGLVALVIRARVAETPLFEKVQSKGKTLRAPLRESLSRQPRAILLTFALAGFNALSYYLVVAFVPTYLVSFVKVDHAVAMHVAMVAGAFNVAFIAIPAWLSDTLGRKPVLIVGSLDFSYSLTRSTFCSRAGTWPQCLPPRLASSLWRRFLWVRRLRRP